ncbi:ABC transporter ATP-binding protein [Paraglaciecola sp.]|uniref:ABC transporter ATP-binding protein n=1 Tax=Paraglaciecola sp. TaxID=1920173 RepID=UPI0030F3E743
MSLVLKNVSHEVGGQKYLDNVNLTLESGSFNVLLGRTLAGKTTLMRLMAGLEKPTSGQILMNGHDVTGVAVQKRNVSMVYQQFINYPNLTVRENIASPLRLANVNEAEINRRVKETADMLQISQYLDRLPLELSGGQQQRTSMARALVKDASLILFDEPLVNLDYKLREELRSELRVLFAERQSIAIYATTEANEALALGGVTTLIHEGRILQSGAVSRVYRTPKNVEAAKLFCEPPINLIEGQITLNEVSFYNSVHFALDEKLKDLPKRKFIFGVKPSHISLVPKNDDDLELPMKVELAEISGSETYLHVYNTQFSLILQLSGVINYAIDTPVKVYLPIHKLFVFDLNGLTIKVPEFDMENL